MRERTLVERAKDDDRASQEVLVRLYEKRVYGLILRLVGNSEDARDILQDTMVKALTSLDKHDSSYPFLSWLLRIATNKAIDFLRRRKIELRFVVHDDDGMVDNLPDTATAPDKEIADRIDREILERCMHKLEPRYRAVLLLRYKDGLPYKEISRALSIPMGTVKVLLHRGRAKLKREVRKEVGLS